MKTTITKPSSPAPRATDITPNARTPTSRTAPLDHGRRLVRGLDGRMVEISIKPASGRLATTGFVIGLYRCGLQRL